MHPDISHLIYVLLEFCESMVRASVSLEMSVWVLYYHATQCVWVKAHIQSTYIRSMLAKITKHVEREGKREGMRDRERRGKVREGERERVF